MQPTRAGRWVKNQTGAEVYSSFSPLPLPPKPPILFDEKLQLVFESATRSLGLLEGVSTYLPNPTLLLYSFVRKEAVLSSQIEGTQSSLSDLLLFENLEAPGVPTADVQEVSNYVAAMNHGLRRLKIDNFPLSLRLLKEIHRVLMKDVRRGGDKEPGEFRHSQNWIGGTRPGNAFYVPPPPDEVIPAMGSLEKFLHDDPIKVPTLIKAGLAHAQFETIHPFLDGNGRLGRLLITFILCAEGALSEPLLYLSLYFKKHRPAYYDALQRVRTDGDWEGWLSFYLTAVHEISVQASASAKQLISMFEEHRQQIQKLKGAATAHRVHDLLKERVVVSLAVAARELPASFPTVSNAMGKLRKLGFVDEITGKQRNRIFCYTPYLRLLTADTDAVGAQLTSEGESSRGTSPTRAGGAG